jgi:hypothetical protein
MCAFAPSAKVHHGTRRNKSQAIGNFMGNMARVRVTIRGTRPLFQHVFGEDAIPLEKAEKTGVAGNDPEEWKKTRMVTEDGELYIRGDYVFACLRDGAKHTKKGKGSIQPFLVATLQIEEPIICIGRKMPDGEPRKNDYTAPVYIDVRGVRNPSTKGRNVRYRLAASPGWQCSFTLLWDRTIVSREQMRAIVKDASVLAGIGNGRSIGMGRFEVVAWEQLDDAEETTAERSVGSDQDSGVAPRRKKVRAVPEAAVIGNGAH